MLKIPAALLAIASCAWMTAQGATAQPTNVPDRAIASSPAPTPEQKALVASKLYWAVTTYFAHGEALGPDYDFERAFRTFLTEAFAARTRLVFDEAAMRLLGSLRNGHTWFHDAAMRDEPKLPFRLRHIDGRWIVVQSRLPAGPAGLDPGDAIIELNGRPFAEWAGATLPLLNGSNDTERETSLSAASFLWPDRLHFVLQDGRMVDIDRWASATGPWRGLYRAPDEVTVSEPRPGVVLVAIPGFDDPRYEKDAIRAVKEHRDVGALLLDVRDNGGGSTPSTLLSALIDKPYRDIVDSTPMHLGTIDAWSSLGQPLLSNAMLRTGGEWTRPDHPIFHGRLFVLADRGCASACEDLLLGLRLSHRATLLGETSWGSTGQPFIVDFADLHMQAAVSTRREYLPDLAPFEGVGIKPDIPIAPALDAMRAGRDDVLARALDIAAGH